VSLMRAILATRQEAETPPRLVVKYYWTRRRVRMFRFDVSRGGTQEAATAELAGDVCVP